MRNHLHWVSVLAANTMMLSLVSPLSLAAVEVKSLTSQYWPETTASAGPGPISVWRETLDTPRRNVVSFARVDLTDPQLEVFVQPSADPDGPRGLKPRWHCPQLMQDPAVS